MVQRDELLVSPDMIDQVIETQKQTGAEVVNFGSRINQADYECPNTVKLVAAPDGRVLYFSRAPIPSVTKNGKSPMYQQTGVMAFTLGFLQKFSTLPQTPLEVIESVDMLRVLEHGFPFTLYCMIERPSVLTRPLTAHAARHCCTGRTKNYLGNI